MEYTVVGVRFKPAYKVYYFDPDGLTVQQGDGVIVQTTQGMEFARVAVGPKVVSEDDVVLPLRKVLRTADERDEEQVAKNKEAAAKALKVCQERVRDHGLGMKLAGAEYTFDRSKLVFHYTADGRVDFRELVKDLVGIFRTRIEMHQFGVRDEAKMLGGVGPCGRILCCSSWLEEFDPVSIRMAKDQNLSLNPAKISGLCGRLMCCLKFESETYEERTV